MLLDTMPEEEREDAVKGLVARVCFDLNPFQVILLTVTRNL